MKKFKFLLSCALVGIAGIFIFEGCSKKSSPNPTPTSTATVTVTTFAGSTTSGSTNGTGTAASFFAPSGVVFDAQGNLYVADEGNNVIRKITSGGVVSTFAGSGTPGSANGTGTAATFNFPQGLAIDGSGNIYVADAGNRVIREITPGGVVSTLAGSGQDLFADGTGTAASFRVPECIAIDAGGNLYVTDYLNIRKVTPAGVVTTIAGTGGAGAANGTGTAASFFGVEGIAIDGSGNLYVADEGNNLLRKITSGGVVTTLAGSGTAQVLNGTGTAASFNGPQAVVLDKQGNIYVSDSGTIRKVTTAGVVTAVAGSAANGSADGTGAAASFSTPFAMVFDASGNLFVADTENNEIRKLAF